jgi:CelD/BcsL family acetyltransferase involved in cellulose biosynthesis
LRNIEKAYEVELELVPPGPHVHPAMREFIDMHQERWVRDGHMGVFADPRRATFHCEVADRLSHRGWLFLAFLRANAQRCAANYGFSFRGVLSTYLGGSREIGELWKYSPGRVLHAKSMEWAIDNGRTVYDFMRGREHYKYEFDAVDVPNWSIVAYRRRPGLTAAKHRLDLSVTALRRRTQREVQALLAMSRQEGWISISMLKHVAGRVRRGLNDLLGLLGRRARLENRKR